MTEDVEIRTKPKFELLFEENIDRFNRLVADGKAPDMRGANLSGLDLKKADLRGLDLSGSYFRGTNLRGVDLTGCNLDGASMQGALISGALFPHNVHMEEVRMSVEFGTRIRISAIHDKLLNVYDLLEEIRDLLKGHILKK
jgi:hypothetical protein